MFSKCVVKAEEGRAFSSDELKLSVAVQKTSWPELKLILKYELDHTKCFKKLFTFHILLHIRLSKKFFFQEVKFIHEMLSYFVVAV